MKAALGRWLAATLLALAAGNAAAAGAPAAPAGSETAIFAGGCFWCMESDFEKVPGVSQVISGYTGGRTAHPTYEEVGSGTTGHAEAVEVVFDPKRVGYAQLVDYFWHHIDPTVRDRQFCDVGSQYRTAIFWQNDAQRKIAEASRDTLHQSGRFAAIYTELAPASTFWPAETYHQDYYKKNPIRYRFYRATCGRDQRLEEIWSERK